ncbi:MAG TPA: nucleoid-associated protein, YbaB/EbfC family [Lentisphaeria bacterium]|nr:MAG: nucleoid-associated protein, YbaB/EbfC family [Lentisphaerae bacterium GWF2_49_21]HBC89053.1 nucleoid-associated protein, YbaB/EbfC family [Lentisphaeria bacterium]
MFGKLGDMANILQKAQEMQKKMAAVQDEILKLEGRGESAGGLVEAVAGGDFTVRRITIKDECLKTSDPEIIQEHVMSAVNSALEQIKMKSKEKMAGVTSGIDIPGLSI